MKSYKILGIAIIVLFIGTAFAFHDFHSSTTKIELDEEKGLLSISSKYFTDDLEKAVGAESTNANFKNLVKNYAKKHFTLKINGEVIHLNFLGIQDTNKATRIYFEVKNVGKIQEVDIKNSMIIGTFPDQQNFIDFTINGLHKSVILRKGKEVGNLTF